MSTYTGEIQILHLTDLHFGGKHICLPAEPTAAKTGIPSLHQLIADDINKTPGIFIDDITDYATHIDAPLFVAATGDFTQTADHQEFESAEKFLNGLLSQELLGRTLTREDLFIVPGNHDVVFDKPTSDQRFQPYSSFYSRLFKGVRAPIQPSDPLDITQIHALTRDDNKVIFAEINCCTYVEKDTPDESRGQVDIAAIAKLRTELAALSKQPDFDEYIKVVLIHHHVVLIPSFIERGRGVDSVVNARQLLELLGEFGFHVILHGHKHYPQIFTYDPVTPWAAFQNSIPQVVIAGGSCGSSELPVTTTACNTYSIITIKWHPDARQARVKVITRGLQRTGPLGDLTPDLWKWSTINISDKVVAPYNTFPPIGKAQVAKLEDDTERKQEYERVVEHFPVVEVLPSLIPGQAYEARAWIVEHRPDREKKTRLERVEWSAGPLFKQQSCTREENPNFCIGYQYWGSMLLKAKMYFEDGSESEGYVYARMPKNEALVS